MNVPSKKTVVALILLCALAALLAYTQQLLKKHNAEEARKTTLTFTSTQTWDAVFLANAHAALPFSQSQLATISLPPPPTNTSNETKTELEALHNMVALRTPLKIEEMESEMLLNTAFFGTTTFESIINPELRPHTATLFDIVSKYERGIIFFEKEKYNRVRPSFLDPTLTTVIDVPPHPAYPSGHATQVHIIATILSKLDPQNTELYFASAARIAKNREIAGVHYQSDTEAGTLLATQLLPLFFADEYFARLFELAQTEWVQ